MRPRSTAAALLLILLLPLSAGALDTALVPGDENDLLNVIALPLAVAAVADVAGVPVDELANLVGVLNEGAVPARQMIEVIRYAPVALVVETKEPVFVPFVREQVSRGVTGTQLVTAIDQRLRTFDVTPQFATSEVTVIDSNFVPQPVIVRVNRVRAHPHGGPPGQLKKVAGVQTGAEIVHGEKRHHDDDHREVKVEKRRGDDHENRGHGGGGHGEHGGGNGKAKGHGNGKGKG
jgi:hypothetical protein